MPIATQQTTDIERGMQAALSTIGYDAVAAVQYSTQKNAIEAFVHVGDMPAPLRTRKITVDARVGWRGFIHHVSDYSKQIADERAHRHWSQIDP